MARGAAQGRRGGRLSSRLVSQVPRARARSQSEHHYRENPQTGRLPRSVLVWPAVTSPGSNHRSETTRCGTNNNRCGCTARRGAEPSTTQHRLGPACQAASRGPRGVQRQSDRSAPSGGHSRLRAARRAARPGLGSAAHQPGRAGRTGTGRPPRPARPSLARALACNQGAGRGADPAWPAPARLRTRTRESNMATSRE